MIDTSNSIETELEREPDIQIICVRAVLSS